MRRNRSLRDDRRGQVLPLIALLLVALAGLVGIGIDTSTDTAATITDENAADAGAMSAAWRWHTDYVAAQVPAFTADGSPFGTEALTVRYAQQAAYLNGVTTQQQYAVVCAGGATGAAELDVRFYDVSPTSCLVATGWKNQVEVIVYNSWPAGSPGDCLTKNVCVQVKTTKIITNGIEGVIGIPRSTIVNSAIAMEASPPTLED